MSYAKAMKWGRKHPKGTKQPMLMHTNSGFWPSHGFLSGDWWPYLERCKAAGVEPMECEAYYRSTMRGGFTEPATEPTEQGLQYVIPGCEKDRTRGPKQGDLF